MMSLSISGNLEPKTSCGFEKGKKVDGCALPAYSGDELGKDFELPKSAIKKHFRLMKGEISFAQLQPSVVKSPVKAKIPLVKMKGVQPKVPPAKQPRVDGGASVLLNNNNGDRAKTPQDGGASVLFNKNSGGAANDPQHSDGGPSKLFNTKAGGGASVLFNKLPGRPMPVPPKTDGKQLPRYEGVVVHELVVSSGQADVYRGVLKALNKEVAIKVLRDDHDLEAFKEEGKALLELHHENIVRVFALLSEPVPAVVTEWMAGGTLTNFLQQCRKENRGRAKSWDDVMSKIAVGMARGLEYLHGKGIVHRDLKSPNVLLGKDRHPVLIDFGMSKAGDSKSVVASKMLGTYYWMSPEMMEHQKFSFASDIYAFGIILWEMSACELPYQNMSCLMVPAEVLKGNRPPVDAAWPRKIVDLMQTCWSQNSKMRPTASEVVAILSKLQSSKGGTEDLKQAFVCLRNGEYAKAQEHLLVAAEEGNVEAMFRLGFAFFLGGFGFSEDLSKAVMWLQKASELGYGPAMAVYARLFKDGKGVDKYEKEADSWGKKALASGDSFASGYCYDFGLGVKQDYVKAVEWFEGS